MSPVLAAMLGGSAVAAGTYSYQKLKPYRAGNGKAVAALAELIPVGRDDEVGIFHDWKRRVHPGNTGCPGHG